ncbi:MAG: outer membrane protein assembly factor BamE [Gammaproteobacteria bacterium]|nr:outer membrane protein assembly factor BamE [Gammaproteobacteria bacterium]
MINPRYKLCLFIVALTMMSSGCLYRPDIQQGNELTDEMIASISLGMTKNEVADILGVPLIMTPLTVIAGTTTIFSRMEKPAVSFDAPCSSNSPMVESAISRDQRQLPHRIQCLRKVLPTPRIRHQQMLKTHSANSETIRIPQPAHPAGHTR